MDKITKKNFRVIGRCAETQTISLDQASSLCDGIPYEIDFSWDFSVLQLDGHSIRDVPTSTLIEAIDIVPNISDVPCVADWHSYNHSQTFWEDVERQVKKERKREKKWAKKHPKPKNSKEAMRNFNRAVAGIMRGIDYE